MLLDLSTRLKQNQDNTGRLTPSVIDFVMIRKLQLALEKQDQAENDKDFNPWDLPPTAA